MEIQDSLKHVMNTYLVPFRLIRFVREIVHRAFHAPIHVTEKIGGFLNPKSGNLSKGIENKNIRR